METFELFFEYWREASIVTQRGIVALFLAPFAIILLMGIMEKILERKEVRK